MLHCTPQHLAVLSHGCEYNLAIALELCRSIPQGIAIEKGIACNVSELRTSIDISYEVIKSKPEARAQLLNHDVVHSIVVSDFASGIYTVCVCIMITQ